MDGESILGTLLDCEDEQEEKRKRTQRKKYCKEEQNVEAICGVIKKLRKNMYICGGNVNEVTKE